MNLNWETFLLYYTAWHEGEFDRHEDYEDFGLRRVRRELIEDLGEEGFRDALAIFSEKVKSRAAAGINKTLYESIKEGLSQENGNDV